MDRIPVCAILISLCGWFPADSHAWLPTSSIGEYQEQEPRSESEDEMADRKRFRERDLQVESAELQMLDDPSAKRGMARRSRGSGTVVKNGIKTTKSSDSTRDITITEDPPAGIVVEVTRHYGPDDIDLLKRRHPELVDYVELFPKQSGPHEIQLNLAIKSVYRAADLEQLKNRHPEAFSLYRRHRDKSVRIP